MTETTTMVPEEIEITIINIIVIIVVIIVTNLVIGLIVVTKEELELKEGHKS
jgi:hypothetical protein